MDELSLVEAIRARLGTADARVAVGIGDDAAVLAPLAQNAVLSVDAAVEGVHFDRRWLTLEDVGFRSYVTALSDLAAMGARPIAGLLSLVLPRALTDHEVLSVIDGVAEAARVFDAPVVGGNVTSGPALMLSSTVVGEAAAERALLRRGAEVGDTVHVTGTVGAAALGLALSSADRMELEGAAPFVARWRRPRARFDVRDALLDAATAAIDVSDGLAGDLAHVCRASGVGAVLEAARLPVEADHHRLATALGRDGDVLALAGGEDYELVFTAKEHALPWATAIGLIVEGSGVTVLGRDGQPRALASLGYRHR
jgi:thiamine-monophosphate kinase